MPDRDSGHAAGEPGVVSARVLMPDGRVIAPAARSAERVEYIPGVESIADGFSVIRIRLKTLPLNQNKVANELRRRIVTTFVARGIRPYAG